MSALFLCLLFLPPICVPEPLNTSNKAVIPEGLPIQEIIPPLALPSPDRSIVLHVDLVIVALGDKWDKWIP